MSTRELALVVGGQADGNVIELFQVTSNEVLVANVPHRFLRTKAGNGPRLPRVVLLHPSIPVGQSTWPIFMTYMRSFARAVERGDIQP